MLDLKKEIFLQIKERGAHRALNNIKSAKQQCLKREVFQQMQEPLAVKE